MGEEETTTPPPPAERRIRAPIPTAWEEAIREAVEKGEIRIGPKTVKQPDPATGLNIDGAHSPTSSP
jgi:hypothetical protein